MSLVFSLTIPQKVNKFFKKNTTIVIYFVLSLISIVGFIYYYFNGLGLAFNDSRSHLDIGRRVVEGLSPGFSQLGSVWLPLPHMLMSITIWNDFMWHSGLAGAIPSMIAYVATSMLIYSLLQKFGVSLLGRIMGLVVFALNINIIYLQSTALTELLLLGTMTAGVYELMLWHKEGNIYQLIKSAFWIMISTLIRYDGWFLLIMASIIIILHARRYYGNKSAEGILILFFTLGGFGVFLWLLWNLMIFHDLFYFAVGPYSAHAQQEMFLSHGLLSTKNNLVLSTIAYLAAIVDNTSIFIFIISVIGMITFWLDKKIASSIRIASIAFLSPLFFNIAALYFGHSALFIAGITSNSWFNVRYGVMMLPALAFFLGYTIDKLKDFRFVVIGIILFFSLVSLVNHDSIVLNEALNGSSGKSAPKVSQWLSINVPNKNGYVLISAASHDEIIFSSGLSMKKIISEGARYYWDLAITHPDQYVRWIVMEPNNINDSVTKTFKNNPKFKKKYYKVQSSIGVDVYELKPQYLSELQAFPNFTNTIKK